MTRTWQCLLGVIALVVLAGCTSPPQLVPHITGGRVQAITVNPADPRHIVVANEFGGLWATRDGGRSWRYLDALPTAFAFDVQFGTKGRTLVATLGAHGPRVERGGIWLSRDAGHSWVRPVRGAVPHAGAGPAGANAWGISVAPDADRRWYVGTDSGVARSDDNGESWQHIGIDRGLPAHMTVNRRGTARSVLALAGGVVLAMLDDGLHRSADHGLTWDKILEANFAFNNNPGLNNLERSPDGRLAFILKDYATLLVYDPATGSFTDARLPAELDSRTKGAFVRVTQAVATGAAPQRALTIWIGQGSVTRFATVSSPEAIALLRPADWTALGRAEGIDTDTGDLGVSADFQPVLLGSDGGGFKPVPGKLLRWENASARGNSP